MANITVYSFQQTVTVTMTGTNASNYNIPLTDSDFKIYKGVDNPIDFLVRDTDRRPVDLTDATVMITVFSYDDGSLLMQKDADIIDALCGKIRVIFTAAEIQGWPLGYQRYSLTAHFDDGTSLPLFMDQDSNASGYLEVYGGILPAPVDSIIVDGDCFTPVNSVVPGPISTYYISSAYPGDAVMCQNDGLHTVAVYLEDYTGTFFVQGSLVESPTTSDDDWFDVWLSQSQPELTLDGFTGIEPFNFTGSIRWVRFKYVPDGANTGKVDKVVYRN